VYLIILHTRLYKNNQIAALNSYSILRKSSFKPYVAKERTFRLSIGGQEGIVRVERRAGVKRTLRKGSLGD